ncbi:MAG: hypothetical protein HY820_19095 [Acidobacteria bacterium]|nr:hypothetical protein [Acidobacteriota bacterium]
MRTCSAAIAVLCLIGGGSAAGVDVVDARQLEGRWRGQCSWGSNIKHTREPQRLLRVLDNDTIEVLDWIEGTQSSDDPRMDQKGWVVLSGPVRVIVKRTGNATFADEDEELVLKFSQAGSALEMERGQDACNGMGGEYSYQRKEKTIAPSFSCAKTKHVREQAVCGNAALAILDQHLSLAYRAAEQRIKYRYGMAAERTAQLKALTTTQNRWSGEVGKCQSAQCVEPLYVGRIEVLSAIAADEK